GPARGSGARALPHRNHLILERVVAEAQDDRLARDPRLQARDEEEDHADHEVQPHGGQVADLAPLEELARQEPRTKQQSDQGLPDARVGMGEVLHRFADEVPEMMNRVLPMALPALAAVFAGEWG